MVEINENTLTWDKIEEELTEYWKKKKLKKFIKAVKEDDNTFSWTEDEYINNSEKLPNSSKYCIPTQITGSPQEAVIFLCLFNPSVPNKKMSEEGIRFYLEKVEDAVTGADCGEKLNHINPDRVIVNTRTTILQIEWEIQKNRSQKIKDLEEKIKKQKTKDLEETLKKEKEKKKKDGYYTKHYFNGIKRSIDIDLFNEDNKADLSEKEQENEFFSKLPVCDLELVPYRARTKGVLANKKFLENSKAVSFTVEIIIRRIFDYWEQIEQGRNVNCPIFFMRSVSQYKEAINSFLEKNEVKFDGNRIKYFQTLINNNRGKESGTGKHLFFELSQSGSMIYTGVRPLPNAKELENRDTEYKQAVKHAINQVRLNN